MSERKSFRFNDTSKKVNSRPYTMSDANREYDQLTPAQRDEEIRKICNWTLEEALS